MTDEELQDAIDKCISAVKAEASYNDMYKKVREAAVSQLIALYKVQAIRAGLQSYPAVKIQEALDKKADNARELGLSYD